MVVLQVPEKVNLKAKGKKWEAGEREYQVHGQTEEKHRLGSYKEKSRELSENMSVTALMCVSVTKHTCVHFTCPRECVSSSVCACECVMQTS